MVMDIYLLWNLASTHITSFSLLELSECSAYENKGPERLESITYLHIFFMTLLLLESCVTVV